MIRRLSKNWSSVFTGLAKQRSLAARLRGKDRMGFRKLGAEPLETRMLLTVSTSTVLDFSDFSEIEGASSELTRDNDSVSLAVDTNGLDPGAYTVWWVAFNDPEYCVGNCGEDDLGREGVNTSVMLATGGVVDETGGGSFAAQLQENDATGAILGDGLNDANKAEIHFVIRNHGPASEDPVLLDEQLTSFNGGCETDETSGFACVDAQAGIHLPFGTDVSVGPVVEFAEGLPPIEGTESRLTRDDDGVTLTVDTNGLDPGAYTVWWVAFDNPEYCVGNCGEDDLGREEVNTSVIYGAGDVVDETGVGSFAAHLDENASAGAILGDGLKDARKAEIHFVIRNHGPASEDPVLLDEQLTSFNGGCETDESSGFACFDPQAGIHLAPGRQFSMAPMVEFADPTTEFEGSLTKLTRDEDSVSVRADATGLVPGDAVTAWWAVFNQPEFCDGECGPSSLGDPEVGAALVYADGAVVGEDGTATFMAKLDEGDTSGVDPDYAGLPGADVGLADSMTSAVHLVLRTHGPALPEGDPGRTEQLTTNGGCNPDCANIQAAIHDPPEADVNISPVLDFSSLQPIEGATSRLTRFDDSVAVNVDTSGLEPGAYTVWLVAFNNPEFCVGDCSEPDLLNDKADASPVYASGGVVGEDGEGHFAARLQAGDTSGALFGPGLVDTDSAEIHVVLRHHGPASDDPAVLQEQLTIYQSCNPECADLQAAIHRPANPVVLGDSDGDGRFDPMDITHVLQAGKYETDEPADFSEGDWNGDGVFNRFDLIDALMAGSYRRGLPFEKQFTEIDDGGNAVWEGEGRLGGVDVDIRALLPVEPEPGFSQEGRLRSLTEFTFSATDPATGANMDAALQGLLNMGSGEIDLYGIVTDSDFSTLPVGSHVGIDAHSADGTVIGTLRTPVLTA